MRAYVSRLLGARYEVEAVADGQAALEAARAHPPDLVLSDIMMPRLDGFGLLRALRADPATTEIPVIFLSARAGEESRIEGLDAGADDYLVKPFSARELIARVSAHLELARMRREILEEQKRVEVEASRRKDEFLAILAHELRNPLGPVRNAAHYLKLRALPDPELRRPIEMIESQVTHMSRLIDDLLDVARITRGMVELRLERLLLRDVAEAAVDACRDEIEGRTHTLLVTLPEEPVTLLADRQRLVQVFGNLIGNAVKFTPPGGRIEITAVLVQDEIHVSVADNGVGIPPEKLGEIFELFTQVDRSLERQGGLGIGLTLARQLIGLHRGSLEAKSQGQGRGSTFVVRLPIVSTAVPDQEPVATPASPPRVEQRRVLVADDNRDAADSMAILMGGAGHLVRVAYDGAEALSVAEEFRPDVAFLDIGMPKMNGYDVARRLREARGASIRLIALTGWGQDSDRQRSEEAGFDEHLVKPVSPDVFTRMLRNGEAYAAEAATPPASPASTILPASQSNDS
jgi:signal transduction histidine kinase